MKHSRSSNNLTIMLGIATVCLSLTLIKEKTESTKIINNDNVRIEYTKLDKNNYNLIIQTKNDTNIQSKNSLEVGQNYGSLYLEGKSLNYYRKYGKMTYNQKASASSGKHSKSNNHKYKHQKEFFPQLVFK